MRSWSWKEKGGLCSWGLGFFFGGFVACWEMEEEEEEFCCGEEM